MRKNNSLLQDTQNILRCYWFIVLPAFQAKKVLTLSLPCKNWQLFEC